MLSPQAFLTLWSRRREIGTPPSKLAPSGAWEVWGHDSAEAMSWVDGDKQQTKNQAGDRPKRDELAIGLYQPWRCTVRSFVFSTL
jgi:hypothetical protein